MNEHFVVRWTAPLWATLGTSRHLA